ncbi:hemerythrin domain-containing protein [Teredinibacter purpureus]|uniref:hemerythrin domain-containing protein n=1 Tax=Teredinibacter purpureus TaxID=2731756 RepID=UPI0005F7C091|nr:hemerythrin domain-containing protein [Teredinibacter purpureus]
MSILDVTLEKLAVEIPGATEILYRFKLDYKQHHSLPLRDAITEYRADKQSVIEEFERLEIRGKIRPDFSQYSEKDLVLYIVTHYHNVHRKQLPELIRLASTVEKEWGHDPLCPVGLSQCIRNILEDTLAHMDKEEKTLFPMIIQSNWDMAANCMAIFQFEHGEHVRSLKKLQRSAHNFQLPTNACSHWKALYMGLQAFITTMRDHIHLEDTTLFARMPDYLSLSSRS